jgi:hypothetical protein
MDLTGRLLVPESTRLFLAGRGAVAPRGEFGEFPTGTLTGRFPVRQVAETLQNLPQPADPRIPVFPDQTTPLPAETASWAMLGTDPSGFGQWVRPAG